MYHAGGPKLLLDRRASSPRTPGCLVPSQTTPEGTPVRLAPSQSAQGDPPPSRTTVGPPGWSNRWPTPCCPHLRGSFMLVATNGADIRRRESTMTSLAHRGFVHLGMDVSKDSISVAILPPDRDTAVVDKISSDGESVRRLIKRVGRPKGIWACYEAGPTGYDLYRLLGSMGVRCDVVAPSLVPKGRGDRVKTDKLDGHRIAGPPLV